MKPLTRYIITKVAAGKDHSAAVDCKYHGISNIVIHSHFQFLVQQNCITYNILPEEVIFFEDWLNSADFGLVVYECLYTKYIPYFFQCMDICSRLDPISTDSWGWEISAGVRGFVGWVGVWQGRWWILWPVGTVSRWPPSMVGSHCHLKVFWSTHVHQQCTIGFEYTLYLFIF